MTKKKDILRDIEQTPEAIRAWLDEVADWYRVHPIKMQEMKIICNGMTAPTSSAYGQVRSMLLRAMTKTSNSYRRAA